ncbi:MAG: hypothetical protein ACFFDY_01410 [Candidatus Thorarchaeota archaeon]
MLQNKHISGPVTPIFFLSTGRTATQWLAWALNVCYNSVLAVHEPPPMIKPIGLLYHAKKLKFNDAVRACRKARMANVRCARILYKKCYYIECNHNLFSLAEPLRKTFPGCKIVGLVRDYRTFIPSMANRGYENGVSWLKSNDPKIDTGKKQLAWYWKEKISCYIDSADCIFDIKDLYSEMGNGWYKMVGFLGLRFTPRTYYDFVRSIRFNTAKRGKMPNWEKWSDSDKQDVINVIGQDFINKVEEKVL